MPSPAAGTGTLAGSALRPRVSTVTLLASPSTNAVPLKGGEPRWTCMLVGVYGAELDFDVGWIRLVSPVDKSRRITWVVALKT